jgi:hypothetical protein
MRLVVNKKSIEAPIATILSTLKLETHNGKLKDIGRDENDNVPITCPIHKMGNESHPSCNVYTRKDNPNVEYGKCHCFTCGWTASLPKLVSVCFGVDDVSYGEEWLESRFGSDYSDSILCMPEIELKQHPTKKFLSEGILSDYNYYDDYMWKRGLTKEVVDKFKVGYDPKRKVITFPVWDDQGNLVMVTTRSTVTKQFYIEKDVDKPVYLLNFLKNDHITTAYVCESQINALTLWSYGYPAIALFGTGSRHQYDILNRSQIRNYILCFDGDDAGDKGIKRFLSNIRDDVLVSIKKIPRGKDVNDLSKEEFDNLTVYY